MNPLRCAACGVTDYGVQTRVVEVTPEREIRLYTDSPLVPERFKVEPRCIDKEACDNRPTPSGRQPDVPA